MGEQEGWTAQQAPSGHLLNGLLSNGATSMIRVLDSEQWAKAEERAAQLIACIQPDAPSESRRNAVADYVQRLISKCFPCQVFTFGSVPLKTYLPDGDIDLTAFSKDQNLKDTWAHQVRDMLENEEKHENAEFQVKEVQYIQAEVKLVKCLVENIVVDISFNQLGGLCTLCFLEEVDLLISQNHLFKRSIILIKAWCYYESRVLGAHHGLISTYALETLVLYIFHVYNNSFSGPLEVLYRFLEFFSKFDWENFCVSLWGPVPIRSLPDITAEPPRRDGGELLLSKYFLDTCSSRYAVCQENQRQPFVSKHFNVVDPLRLNNNLGRSVSKGNFFRIRSAFSFGAKQLARLLDCPKEDLYYEVNQFFTNTWERHGCGQRPDAPRIYARPLEFPKLDNSYGSKNARNISSSKGSHISSGDETEAEGVQVSCGVSSRYVSHLSEIRISDVSTVFHTQSQKSYGSMNNSKTSDQVRKGYNSNQNVHNDTAQRVFQADNLLTDVQGRYLFARTRSSPELTETYEEATSRGRQNRMPESGKTQSASMRSDNNGRKNMESVMMASSRQSIDTAADSNSLLISNQDDNDRDWNPPSTVGTERAERTVGPQLESSFPVSKHQLPGFEETQTSGSDPQIPIAPFLLGPGSGHRTMDNSAVPPFAFTITGPPVPFLFFPVYNIPSETGTPDSSTSHFNWDEGLDHNDSGKIFELSEGIDQSEVSSTSSSMRKVSSLEPSEHKSDILNGDIASHWQNLQYGRFCQNSRYPPNLIYPSPFVVPPVYLQGHFPWDGPGRTPSSNMNIFSQIVNNGPRILPSNPLQSVSNRPTSAFQRYVDEMPRYRSGTGTYLPNPKASMRERHSANMRRGKYNYDRNGYQGDKEGNWNANSKSRTAGHSHGRNQNEKSRFTFDQFPAVSGESRAERPWGSHRHDSFTSYESRNGPVRSNSQSSSASMPHGMYPVAAMNPNGSVVMLYPYDHNSSYGSPAEQLEFGSFGPVGFSGMNEVSQVSDGSSSSGVYDEHRFYGTSAQRSSPDQPSSPTSKGGL